MERSELQLTLSGEIFLKSARVRKRFIRAVCQNAETALGGAARVRQVGPGRVGVAGFEDMAAAVSRLQRVFGVRKIDEVVRLPFPNLERGVAEAAALAGPSVEGRSFAVRCKRVGSHDFRSSDVERELGSLLLGRSGGVNLTEPDVTVRLRVVDEEAWLTRRRWEGPGGLPLGVQGRALVLLSGGYDSAVAAHQLMRRGVQCEFVHFQLACDQRDQALAVAHHLWKEWGAGMAGIVHVLDFSQIRAEIMETIHPRLRQVVLKRIMLRIADWTAAELDMEALATGEAIGQVSSQTFANLTALDSLAGLPVLRPLLTADKEEIIDEARRIGVAEFAERAGEACNLAEGHRVETATPPDKVDRAAERVSHDALQAAFAAWRVHDMRTWLPGSEGEHRPAA